MLPVPAGELCAGTSRSARPANEFQVDSVPALTEVCRVAQPQSAAVFADELAREIQEVGLLTGILHVGDHPPWPCDGIGLQNVGSHLRHRRSTVGHAHRTPTRVGIILSIGLPFSLFDGSGVLATGIGTSMFLIPFVGFTATSLSGRVCAPIRWLHRDLSSSSSHCPKAASGSETAWQYSPAGRVRSMGQNS